MPCGAPGAAFRSLSAPRVQSIQTNSGSTGLISIDMAAERINDTGGERGGREEKHWRGKSIKEKTEKWGEGKKKLTKKKRKTKKRTGPAAKIKH